MIVLVLCLFRKCCLHYVAELSVKQDSIFHVSHCHIRPVGLGLILVSVKT
jgi:hypothetical protein